MARTQTPGRAKAAIQGQGRTITFLADKLGIHRSLLSRQLDGKRPLSRERAERLAEITGIPIELFPVTDLAREEVSQ